MAEICVWGVSLKKVADEAQLEAFVKICRERVGDAHFTLFSRDAEAIVARHRDLSAIDTRDLPRIMRALSRADVFVLVGGPFFEELYQTVGVCVLTGAARLFGCPTVSYGTTAFPFHTRLGRFVYRRVFESFAEVTVREETSREILGELGVRRETLLFPDPRFVLEAATAERTRAVLLAEGIDPDRPCVGLTTRYLHADVPGWVRRGHHLDAWRVDTAYDSIAAGLAEVGREAQLVQIPLHPLAREDEATASELRRRLPPDVPLRLLGRRYPPAETLGLIRHCGMVIAGRLGSAVFATVTGTPLVAIAYEPRMLSHMRMIGLEDCAIDIREADVARVTSLVARVWRERAAMRERVQARAASLAEMARTNSRAILAHLPA